MNPALAVKRARQSKHFSQEELAVRIGVTQGAVNHYETGRRIPTITTLEKIADACQFSLVEIMKLGEEQKPVHPSTEPFTTPKEEVAA